MSDRNCWKCGHNRPEDENSCALLNRTDNAEEEALLAWISTNVNGTTAMPRKSTKTECPGFTPIPEAV